MIPLRDLRGNVIAHAKISPEDARWLSAWEWHLHGRGYACRCENVDGRSASFMMHREILGLKLGDGLVADHANHDKLDNRRPNLRIVTNRQNSQNRAGPTAKSKTGVRNVTPHGSRFRVCIRTRGQSLHCGVFASIDEAARVAEAARRDLGFLGGEVHQGVSP